MDEIIRLEGLTKVYKKTPVVDSFNISIKKGHIYGLIGPNGAGKTTIMKMMAGLVEPTEGTIELFGSKENIQRSRSRMSFMIEAPYLDGSMTARENMELIRYTRGVADKNRIKEILEFVGLDKEDKKKAKKFSLGMKQRLGLGMALLSSPEIMILDEPINGLDPQGIVEIRHLLRKLCDESGVTILISSHILSELAELCDDFAIIDKGKLIEDLSKEELKQKCMNYLSVSTDDNNRLTTVLEQNLGIKGYKVFPDDEVRIYEGIEDIVRISKGITDSGLVLTRLAQEGESLEEFYLSRVSADEDAKGVR